jgi:hypothetical protein
MSHPSTFYKYTTAETAKLVLEHGKLRWSSPLLFNDLSEFQRMPRYVPTVAESLLAFPAFLNAVLDGSAAVDAERLAPQTRLLLALLRLLTANGRPIAEVSEGLQEEIAASDMKIEASLREFTQELDLGTVRVLCVTTEFDNEAMWANYAAGHTGCVLGLRHIPSLDTPLLAATQVTYSEEQPVVGSGLDFLLYGPSQDLIRRTVHAICFTKKAPWAYENEWRAMTRRTEGEKKHSDFKFYREELESVTLGPRMSADAVESLTHLLRSKYPDCAVYKLEVSSGLVLRREVARGA